MAGAVRFPQVEFYIGSKSLMVPPNFIQQFTYEDTIAMAGDSFTLEFVDPTWEVLDTDLIPSMHANTNKPVSFRWGYGGAEMSRLRYGMVTEYAPSEITRGGLKITMKGFDRASASSTSQERVEATYQGTISQVIRKIAEKHGWSVELEDTGEIYELEGREGGKQLRIWRQNNKTDLEFINELAQRASAKTGSGAYRVYFDIENDPPTLHFHPDRAHREPLHREYVLQTDNLGEVLNFSPEINEAAVVRLGGSNLSLVARDPVTRKLTEEKAAPETFTEGIALGTKSLLSGESRVRQIAPPCSFEEMKARVGSYYEALSWSVGKAALEVLGDPLLDPGRMISVEVKTPSQKNYFVSGVYLLEKVTHAVSAGNYTCQCSLIRNALDVGDIPVAKGTVQRGQ